MNSIKSLVAALLITTVIFVTEANSAVPPCVIGERSLPLESKIASAGITANLFGTESSVKGVAKSLLSSALMVLPSKVRNLCPTPCGSVDSKIYLKATPSKFLSDYEDQRRCESYLMATEKSPLVFEDFRFESIDEFADLFGEFSRGKGEKGRELYEKCDGDCSPQFTLKIRKLEDGTFIQDADVVCGHARDQDDDTYIVSTEVVVNCAGS